MKYSLSNYNLLPVIELSLSTNSFSLFLHILFTKFLMIKFITRLIVFLLLLYPCLTFAVDIKSIQTMRVNETIKVDGELSENSWNLVSKATGFVQQSPNTGKPSRFPTSVKILYDDTGIYIGAMMYDASPDSILKELGTRDAGTNNADLFAVGFDTYLDKQNAFYFMVSASGVQTDSRISPDNEDVNWNAPWYSKAKIIRNGWIVEMKIPYSSLRFADKNTQTWGINFMRTVRRCREESYWNEVQPSVQGFVNQFGELHGINNIKPPLRLMFFPYVSTYLVHDGYTGKTEPVLRGGADVKYGVNESFTLDMTLVPDFGQVQSDNIVYNLTPYEVRFDEYRQFFTEGTELFNKQDLFYSRRVGGRPMNYDKVPEMLNEGEKILKNPNSVQLINASKFSGRTKNKTGIGIFNAITSPSMAIVGDSLGNERSIETNPLTNYNMFVVDQPFMKNSFVSLVNTNVTRFGGEKDANVTGILTKIADQENNYGFSGNLLFSRIYNGNKPPLDGISYEAEAGKYNGNYTWTLGRKSLSDTYNHNDLGYLSNNNEIKTYTSFGWNQFEPKGNLIRRRSDLTVNVGQYFTNKDFTYLQFQANSFFLFKSFFAMGFNSEFYPLAGKDYFATRIPGKYVKLLPGGWINGWISTDYRKKVALDMSTGIFRTFDQGIWQYWINISPRYRVNNHLSIFASVNFEAPRNEVGWATIDADGESVFGRRNVNTFVNTVTTTYTFTPKMSLSLRVRHYALSTKYSEYYKLNEKGAWYAYPQFTESQDLTFNAFNVDCVYQWEFTPSSFLNIVWKNSITDFKGQYIPNYYSNLKTTFEAPQLNSFSVRVVYLLDYQMLKRRKPVS